MIATYLILKNIKKIPKPIVFLIIGFIDEKILCRSNYLSLLDSLNFEKNKAEDYFVNATAGGNLSILLYLEQKFIITEKILNNIFIIAAQKGRSEILGYLIEKGASSSEALKQACYYGQIETVKFLTSFKELYFNEDTCLKIAVKNGHLELAKYIANKYTNFRHKLINKIMIMGCLDVLKIILSKQKVILGGGVLLKVFSNGHIDTAKYLIDLICQKKIILQCEGITLLDIIRGSCLSGQVELVKYLHNLGFDFSGSLEEAVKSKSLELVKYLFELKYSFKAYKFLCVAVKGGNYNLVKFLILKGVNMSSTSDINETDRVLFKAVKSKNIEIVKLLVSYGVKLCDSSVTEALNSIDIFKFLIEKDNNFLKGKFLVDAIKTRNFDAAKYLIDKGVDISYGNYSAYEYAIQIKNYDLVKQFIEKGVDLSIKINEVFDMAIQMNDFHLVNRIINFAEEKNLSLNIYFN